MSYRMARLMTRAAKARTKRPQLWKTKPQWRFIDETAPLEVAPHAVGWAVLQVAPRMEKKAAEDLRDAGYLVWYPQTIQMRTNQQRMTRRKFNEPLFPRYIFASQDRPTSLGMLDCKHVSRIIGVVPQCLMDDLSARQRGGEFIAKKAAPFVKGERVQVTEGVFSSFDGIIAKVGRDRASVLLSIFGRPTLVEFELGQLQEAA